MIEYNHQYPNDCPFLSSTILSLLFIVL